MPHNGYWLFCLDWYAMLWNIYDLEMILRFLVQKAEPNYINYHQQEHALLVVLSNRSTFSQPSLKSRSHRKNLLYYHSNSCDQVKQRCSLSIWDIIGRNLLSFQFFRSSSKLGHLTEVSVSDVNRQDSSLVCTWDLVPEIIGLGPMCITE